MLGDESSGFAKGDLFIGFEERPEIDAVDFLAEGFFEKIPVGVASRRAMEAMDHGFQKPKSCRTQPQAKALRFFQGLAGSRMRH